ncbi:MAG TPA: Bax inhibitor-1 family protein [Solirubrobacteraceae bacterium]
MSFSRQAALRDQALTRDQTRSVFGQVMGLVALTVGCTALGAYITRNVVGGSGILFLFAAFACVFGLNIAASRGHEQLAIALLFGLGLLLGMAFGPILAYYAKAQPDALYQAAGATALSTAALGAYGYGTRRDFSSWGRTLFWALAALIGFGLISLFIAIPNGNVIYCVAGVVIFGAFTIFDFNRLSRTTMSGAVPIAASIFLDIFNMFILLLSLFGGGGSRR